VLANSPQRPRRYVILRTWIIVDSISLLTRAVVHGDVNLRNPGKLAWVVEDSIIVDHRAVFHTKEEAFECGEDWEKERNDLNWTVTICHVEIPVYSSDEED